jgi:cysteine desulfuration protein SufE
MSLPELNEFKASPFGTQTSITDVLDAFEFLDDWEERYGYIIDLGKSLPAFPESEKQDKNYVHGCQSQVWLIHQVDPSDGKIYLMIDSDAIIVKGLAAVVLTMLNAKTAAEILATDIESLFDKLDLIRHVSPTRGNGLRAMIDLVKKVATES